MNKITILGLGPDDITLLTVTANEMLQSGKRIIFRTHICGAAEYLAEKNIKIESCDFIYETAEDFDALDKSIAEHIIKLAKEEDIIYAVPGSGIYGDGSVDMICSMYKNTEIIAGVSAGEYMLAKHLPHGVSEGIVKIPASVLSDAVINTRLPMIITSLDDQYTLTEIKIVLSEKYSDEHPVTLINENDKKDIMLFEIDRGHNVSHTSILYISPKKNDEKYDLYDLLKIFRRLRSPGGCPWDREQDHKSLKRHLIEECAEVLDAIDKNDMNELMDELGDVLLQVMFHSVIAEERGDFDIYSVIENLSNKLIVRHPHVFGNVDVNNSEEVLHNWDEIKKKQRNNKSEAEIMKKYPKNLNALIRAQKVQERAAKVGFDWDSMEGVIDKIREELDEVIVEYKQNNEQNLREELGDLLFAVVNMCRMYDMLSEFVLNESTNKFIDRFETMEKDIKSENLSFSELSLEQMDIFWENAKNKAEKTE
ncbi:MAG: nucleoside triphosphate pyrophosphohydrolase [Clostridia bacterium]|nr:nucleoside triphosphate pyrophosphohydrolase [Clostridia bacterium]